MKHRELAAFRQFCHHAAKHVLELLRRRCIIFGGGTIELDELGDDAAVLALDDALSERAVREPFPGCVVFSANPSLSAITTIAGTEYDDEDDEPVILFAHHVLSRRNCQMECLLFQYRPCTAGFDRDPMPPHDIPSESLRYFCARKPVIIPDRVSVKGGESFAVRDDARGRRAHAACQGAFLEFISSIAMFNLPCAYRVRVAPTTAARGRCSIVNDVTIYRALTPNRIHRVYEDAADTKTLVTPHARRAHVRYHWKRAGLDRKSLPEDVLERLALARRHNVQTSWVESAWVGDGSFLSRCREVRYDIIPSLGPNARKVPDNRMVNADLAINQRMREVRRRDRELVGVNT